MYFADVNRNGNLAYVATSNNQTTLNLVNLNNPNKYYTSKTISEAGILATGGLNAQTLYFIQSSTIDVYRLDTQQYSQSMIHTNLNSERLIKATTGQVMLSSNRTVAYISVYNPERGKLDIINHNLALSKFTSLPIGSNGYPIDLNNGNTLIRVKGNTQSISTPSPSSSSVPSTSKSKNIPTSAPSSIDESLVDGKNLFFVIVFTKRSKFFFSY
jgi:hypothetical protein